MIPQGKGSVGAKEYLGPDDRRRGVTEEPKGIDGIVGHEMSARKEMTGGGGAGNAKKGIARGGGLELLDGGIAHGGGERLRERSARGYGGCDEQRGQSSGSPRRARPVFMAGHDDYPWILALLLRRARLEKSAPMAKSWAVKPEEELPSLEGPRVQEKSPSPPTTAGG